MKTNSDIAAQTARINEAVSKFVPVGRGRFTRLHPFREGITALREKGASYRHIREMLAASGTSVSLDTLGAFVRDVIVQREPVKVSASRRSVRRVYGPMTARHQPDTATTADTRKMPFTVAPPPVDESDIALMDRP
jgi:hypothetical protein